MLNYIKKNATKKYAVALKTAIKVRTFSQLFIADVVHGNLQM